MIKFIAFVILFILWLHRYPQIRINSSAKIVSPTFGTVQKVIHTPYSTTMQIILNVLDPHHQYSPINGVITSQRFIPGSFTPVLSHYFKKTDHNERLITTIQNNDYTVKVTQYGGIVFHRIITDVSVGDRVQKGQQIGTITFGSRVDIEINKRINVPFSKGQWIYAGHTII